MSEIRDLAVKIDAALDTLNDLAQAYLLECGRLNAEHVVRNRYKPHGVYDQGSHYLRCAAGARLHLSRALGLSVGAKGHKLADTFPE
jgi:hypothetical protein